MNNATLDIGNVADETVGNLARTEPASVYRDDFSVYVRNILLPLGNNLWREDGFSVLRYFHAEITVTGIDAFGFVAVASVVRVGAF